MNEAETRADYIDPKKLIRQNKKNTPKINTILYFLL